MQPLPVGETGVGRCRPRSCGGGSPGLQRSEGWGYRRPPEGLGLGAAPGAAPLSQIRDRPIVTRMGRYHREAEDRGAA